jgi:MoxR-like ATPase
LAQYILDILSFSRNSVRFNSLSPRAGIDIANMSKAYAYFEDRNYVLPDDVKKVTPYVVSHRLLLDHKRIDEEILKNVKID